MNPTPATSLVLISLISMSACTGDINKVGTVPGGEGTTAGNGSGAVSTKAVGGSNVTTKLGMGGTGSTMVAPTGGQIGTSVSGGTGGVTTLATSKTTRTGGASGGGSLTGTSGGNVASGGGSATGTSGGNVASGGATAASGTSGQAGTRAAAGAGGFSTTVDGVIYAAYHNVYTNSSPPRETLIVVKDDLNRGICASVTVITNPRSSTQMSLTLPDAWGGGSGEFGMAPGVCALVLQESIPVYGTPAGSGPRSCPPVRIG